MKYKRNCIENTFGHKNFNSKNIILQKQQKYKFTYKEQEVFYKQNIQSLLEISTNINLHYS